MGRIKENGAAVSKTQQEEGGILHDVMGRYTVAAALFPFLYFSYTSLFLQLYIPSIICHLLTCLA